MKLLKTFFFIQMVFSVSAFAQNLSRQKCEFSNEEFKILMEKVDLKDYESAHQFLLTRAKQNSKCALNWIHLGHVYFLRKDYVKASLAYERVFISSQATDDTKDMTRIFLSRSLRMQKKISEAFLTLAEIEDRSRSTFLQSEIQNELQLLKSEGLQSILRDLKDKNYEEAEVKLISMLQVKQNPLLYSALAISLYKQDKLDRQRQALQYGREMSLNQNEDEIFDKLDRLLSKKYSKSDYAKWQGYFDMAVGQDSNVYRTGRSGTSLSSKTLRLGFEAEKNYFTNTSQKSYLRFGISQDDYLSYQSEKYLSMYAVNRNLFTESDFRYELNPQISFDLANDRAYVLKLGIYFDFYKEISDKMGAGVSFDYWRNLPQQKIYQYLSGENQTYSAYVKYLIAEDLLFLIAYNLNKNFSADDEVADAYRVPLAYAGMGPSASLLWSFKPGWNLKLGFNEESRSYTRTYLPENLDRKDRSISYIGKVSYRATDEMVVFFQTQTTARTSTMTETSALDSNWQALTFQLGLGLKAF